MKICKRYFYGIELLIIEAFVFLFSLVSCSKNNYPVKVPNKNVISYSTIPDYSNADYWAASPFKNDPSDSLPAPLSKNKNYNTSADVFFIYPTSFTNSSDTAYNAAINDWTLNNKTDYSSILYQATVFNESCSVYAPRYRQAHIRCFFIPAEKAQPYFDLAYEDVKNAFEYYLAHYNKGRPIIIASHSQGTVHAARLLKEYFDGKPLQHQLICAYIIGMPVPVNYFSELQPCSDSTSTGCIISWRTFKTGYEPDYVKEEKFKAIVVNPLTWNTNEESVAKKFNKGGVLKNFNKIVPHVVSAQVHGNILWTSKPDFFGKIFLRNPNYHVGDINLFYMNIRENVKTRIQHYNPN
ncbi:MAG: DUF3089 domain-containing protein [Bacteroidetes bacterium]|nr:DUF3089 domain-containing protein [Bacteroidota bacterium]